MRGKYRKKYSWRKKRGKKKNKRADKKMDTEEQNRWLKDRQGKIPQRTDRWLKNGIKAAWLVWSRISNNNQTDRITKRIQ